MMREHELVAQAVSTHPGALRQGCSFSSHTLHPLGRVIAKLHTLAADPRNRPFIARDSGCLRNIIRTFDFPADDVSATRRAC